MADFLASISKGPFPMTEGMKLFSVRIKSSTGTLMGSGLQDKFIIASSIENARKLATDECEKLGWTLIQIEAAVFMDERDLKPGDRTRLNIKTPEEIAFAAADAKAEADKRAKAVAKAKADEEEEARRAAGAKK